MGVEQRQCWDRYMGEEQRLCWDRVPAVEMAILQGGQSELQPAQASCVFSLASAQESHQPFALHPQRRQPALELQRAASAACSLPAQLLNPHCRLLTFAR